MKRTPLLNACISIVIALLSGSLYADNCSRFKNLLDKNKYQQVISEFKFSNSTECEQNIFALSLYDSGDKSKALEILSDLSKNNYPPAIYNIANLSDPKVFDGRQKLVLYREALYSSFNIAEFRSVFTNSWESGINTIKNCLGKNNFYCKDLNSDDELKKSFYKVGSDFYEQLSIKHDADQKYRKNVEESILGLISVATYLSIKNAPKKAPPKPSAPIANNGAAQTTNAFGVDQKTYLCILGHISSGASRSVCN